MMGYADNSKSLPPVQSILLRNFIECVLQPAVISHDRCQQQDNSIIITQDRILKKCMWILREELKDYQSTEENFVVVLADTWNYFFRQLLPAVQVIMQGVCLVSAYFCMQIDVIHILSNIIECLYCKNYHILLHCTGAPKVFVTRKREQVQQFHHCNTSSRWKHNESTATR